MDITDVILRQHHEQRQAFALLDDTSRKDPAALDAIWSRLRVLLEAHAEAEEKFFYPRLLTVGQGAGGAGSAAEETKDAIKDHNDIRDAIGQVAGEDVGTGQWWNAVAQVRLATSDHMAEEEREDLPDFRRRASLQERHDIAQEFLGYESSHAQGVTPDNHDPAEYVRSHA